MPLVLILGDIHIPHRKSVIPEALKTLLVPNTIEHVLCTGNLCTKEVLEYLRSLSSNITIVKGDFDEELELPETAVVQIEEFKIGLCHGHQVVPWGDQAALQKVQRRLQVDILITGHTHEFTAFKVSDYLFINPGSITGAYSGYSEDIEPSFILMDIQGFEITTYVYRIRDGEVLVEKIIYVKPGH